MKTITSSFGILALGAVSLHAVYAPGLTTSEASKGWTVSAGVRGFYDDNYNTAPSATSESSIGFEVTPRIGFNVPLDQTLIVGSYEFSGKYFADRPSNEWDLSHQFNLGLDHSFSERYNLKVNENFSLSQDPEVLNGAGNPFRSEGDNLRNVVDILFRGDFSKTFGYDLGYANSFYDFKRSGVGSYSALLDRMEHLISGSLRWFVQPQTTALVGYQYRIVDYTSSDDIVPGFSPKLRNSRSHTVFLGADHDFSSQFRVSARGGLSFTDSYKLGQDSTDPYADVSATYSYSSAGSVQLGVRHQRTQTDVTGLVAVNQIVLAQQSTTAYGSMNHKFTEFLSGNALGFVQASTFDGGSLDGSKETYYSLGFTLKYDFTRNWAAEAGYSLDKLESDSVGRDYTRNRAFVGLRATY